MHQVEYSIKWVTAPVNLSFQKKADVTFQPQVRHFYRSVAGARVVGVSGLQQRVQSSLLYTNVLSTPLRQIGKLIVTELAHGEELRCRMREVKAAHA